MESIVLQLNSGVSNLPAVERSRLIQLLHVCMSDLEPAQKLALELRFWEQMKIEQIALIMKTTWDEVDQLLERTFLELRQMLTERLMAEAAALDAA
jgi:DNA-directed RNA polymerase specialized sigma24 family protein